jgi:3-phosphoshikimate 1-carboxyvinyltransferase
MHIKSPILVASLYSEGPTVVTESVKSRDHTELMLNYFGAKINVEDLTITSNAVEELYAQHVIIPGDISIASYFLTAGLLVPNSDIVVKNVGINPTRTGILDVYKQMGAKIEFLNEHIVNGFEKVADIRVTTSTLTAVTIECESVSSLMDEVPIIAVAATQAKGTTTIKGLAGFKISENNRLKYLATELGKMGASVETTEDSIIIHGGKPLKGTVVESYNDFSITMALAIAGLIAPEETMIRKSQILDTAYPEFLEVINSL